MPISNLPWLPSSEQFLRAIISGSELGEARARRQDAQSRRPRFGGGGGGFLPMATRPVPQPVSDPNLVLNGSILSVVDPRGETSHGIDPITLPTPFNVGSQKFITNPSTGQIEEYVEPSTVEKVGNDLVRLYPKSFKAEKLYEGGNPPTERVSLSTIDTTGMDEKSRTFQEMFNPPRLSGSPSAISNYLAQINGPKVAPSIEQKAAEVIRLTPDGKRAVFDASTKQFLRYAE